jgi:hypothetical protein
MSGFPVRQQTNYCNSRKKNYSKLIRVEIAEYTKRKMWYDK